MLDERRAREAELHDRDQRLPAGDGLRVGLGQLGEASSTGRRVRTVKGPRSSRRPYRLDDRLVPGAPAEVAAERRRIAAGSGSGSRASRSTAVRIIPGVQKPHCRPWCSTKACWSGWSSSSAPRPSIVVTSDSAAWSASTVQLDRSAVEEHGARAALARVAADVVPVSPRPSRSACTRSARLDLERALLAVDDELDASTSAFTRFSSMHAGFVEPANGGRRGRTHHARLRAAATRWDARRRARRCR